MSQSRGGHLILVGMRGAGKTSVGRALAERLDREFVDCDARLEEKRGETVREMFERHGEESFRQWERDTLLEVIGGERRVVATGGGVILRDDNVDDLRRGGVVVYLEAGASTLADRVRRDAKTRSTRPPLSELPLDEELAALLERRAARYRSTADAVVNTDGRTPKDIVEEIARLFSALPCED